MEVRDGYKKTEIGVIPEDWDVKEFGEIFKVTGGGAFKSGDSQQTGVKWLKIANVGINIIKWNEQSYLPKHLIQENKNFLLREGDYVLALTRPILDRKLKISKLKRNDVPALLNQRVGKIESIGDNNIDYIYFLLQQHTSISSLLQSMAGTDPPNLGNKGIYAILSGIPKTKKEQKAIAEVLSDTDNLIQALEKSIDKKRLIKQGAMQELLTPKEGWEVKTLGEIAEIKMGQSPSSSNYNNLGIGLPLIQGNADIKNRKTIIRNYTSQITKKCNIGDLIMSVRAPVGEIARAAFDACIGRGVCAILYTNNFLFHFLIFIEPQWAKHSTGSTFDSVNSDTIRKLEIPFPPLKEQTRIATILSDMETEIEALDKKLAKYKQLKQGLMQNLLTGKIRLV